MYALIDLLINAYQHTMKPPTMMPTVLAALVSAWNRFAWYLDVLLLNRAMTTLLLFALPSREEEGLLEEGKLRVD